MSISMKSLGVLAALAGCAWFANTIYLIFVAIGTFVACHCASVNSRCIDSKSKSQHQTPRRRKMSFLSGMMVHGSFPQQSHAPAPILTCAMLCESCPSVDEYIELIRDRVLNDPKMLRLVSVHNRGNGVRDAYYEPVEKMNFERHFTKVQVDNFKQVEKYLNTVLERELDPILPQWHVHLVENMQPGELSAIYFQVHHSVGDGIGMMTVFGKMVKDEKGTYFDEDLHTLSTKARNRTKSAMPWMTIVKSAWSLVQAIGKTLITPLLKDTITPVRSCGGPENCEKRARIGLSSKMISLDYLKRIKTAAGNHCTINDVATAAFAGSLRRYIELHEQDDRDSSTFNTELRLRAMVPIAFPRDVTQAELGNRWSFISLNLAVSHNDPLQRLARTCLDMLQLKTSPEPYVQLAIQNILSHVLPFDVQRKMALDYFCAHTCVFSNVAGPQKALWLGRHRVIELRGFFPNVILQSILISYDGRLGLSLTLDPKELPDAEQLTNGFVDQIYLLGDLLGIERPCE